jgi:Zn-dependent peptidase ImmA (M78 family)
MAADLEKEIGIQEFNESQLWSSIKDLKKQTREVPEVFIPSVQSICAKAGVLVVWVPELKHTGISGCARWLTDRKAVIALTLRYKTDDQMWFTFFHELGHLLLHRKQIGFVLDNAADTLMDSVIDPPMRAREEEASRFAADVLIPPDELFKFILEGEFSNDSIHSFAEKLNIGPGILVGRLQREGLLGRHEGNALKQHFHWKFGDAA